MPDALDHASRGRRTLLGTVQRLAEAHPHKVYVKQPVARDLLQGFRDVTFLELLHAVDAFAWWLDSQIGRSKNNEFDTIAFLGVTDVRWSIVFFGAIKCGFKSLFLSPTNSVDQILSLFEKTRCSTVLYVSETKETADGLTSRASLAALQVQPVQDWLDTYSHPYSFNKSYEECKWDPILVLHSSGTTGAPKPIVINSGYFATQDRPLPVIPGRRQANVSLWDFEAEGKLAYSPFPSFHLAGVHTQILNPTFTNSTAVLGPSTGIPSASIVLKILEQLPIKIIYAPPALVEGVASSPGGLDKLAQLDVLVYAGGPLAKSCGDALKNDVSLAQIYGCTETGIVPTLVPFPENWELLEFHPDLDYRMELTVDNAYEMILPGKSEMAYTGNPWTFPGSGDWHTTDLFTPDESRPHLWRFYGRTNDVIKLKSGVRFNPAPYEKAMLDHASVAGALVVGNDRPEAAMLLEPRIEEVGSSDASPTAFLDSIWSTVEAVNEIAAPKQRISKQRLGAVPVGGFVRTPKGTVVRGSSATKFQRDIEVLYNRT